MAEFRDGAKPGERMPAARRASPLRDDQTVESLGSVHGRDVRAAGAFQIMPRTVYPVGVLQQATAKPGNPDLAVVEAVAQLGSDGRGRRLVRAGRRAAGCGQQEGGIDRRAREQAATRIEQRAPVRPEEGRAPFGGSAEDIVGDRGFPPEAVGGGLRIA